MQIRKMQEKDIPFIVDMIYDHRKTRVPGISLQVKKEISEILWNLMGEISSYTFVGTMNGMILGFVNFHILDFPLIVGKECYLTDLLVLSSERGQGVGSELLIEAEKFAKENGCTRMMLNNGKWSEAYQRGFYKKFGFHERNNVVNFVKSLQDVV
jgi:GNAT superfamily N-acetyltransferase